MSFSSKVKNQISKRKARKKYDKLSKLAAFVNTSADINFYKSRLILKISTENVLVAKSIFLLIKELYGINVEVLIRRTKHLKKHRLYILYIDNNYLVEKILKDVGILKRTKQGMTIDKKIAKFILEDNKYKRLYIEAAFLSSGSISDPEKGYHLEFVSKSEKHAKDLSNLINSYGLNSKIVKRKTNYIVYIKEAEQISTLLNIIEAHKALMEFENIRILKKVRNDVNRVVNCETANMQKTVNAALKQIKNIEIVENNVGIDSLSKKMQEVAETRRENPSLSLKEIGEIMGISKSAVNHRLRKIKKIAEKYK